jgi:hypothetical protein
VLRNSVPTLIDMATGRATKTPEVERLREIFSGYGETREKQLEAATVSMLKQHEDDAVVSRAEIEFYRVQRTEDQFHKGFRRTGLDLTMLSTIEITPSHVAGFFGYFAVLSLVMLPAALAFARRKTSRWFLLSAGLLLLMGGALNWWSLLPHFSWNGYPDWRPICVGAFLVMMLLPIFGKVSRRRRR